ncbi:hypothetical protein DFA_06856 [Cavenderia fasciculata]|uniref:Uncharacterized protein n=1 Tax=Cavenderia fasciculata TaxID=261658 RepID=F4PWV3_CACFS|nr:uncharacterized protein DFA_06856 [Cavenderia fasciculata]EGG19756.1 hypothetical protein DFA_06856 [Cavenderia fasciculata]|eukprot:XP_004358102.1 hypothetical protein DFA_06856 [Cavenderia fasciculata]
MSEQTLDVNIVGDPVKGVTFTTLNESPDADLQFAQLTGMGYLGGSLFGVSIGLAESVINQPAPGKSRRTHILDCLGKNTAKYANTTASMILCFSGIRKLLHYGTPMNEYSISNNILSGFITGTVVKAPGGAVKAAVGGAVGATLGLIVSLGKRKPEWIINKYYIIGCVAMMMIDYDYLLRVINKEHTTSCGFSLYVNVTCIILHYTFIYEIIMPFACWVEFGNYKTYLTFANHTNYDSLFPTIRAAEQLGNPSGPILLYKDKTLTTLLDQEVEVDVTLLRIYVSSPTQQPQLAQQSNFSNLEQLEAYLNGLGITSQETVKDKSPFMDRENAVESVARIIEEMYWSYHSKNLTRDDHPFFTCLTGAGMGKTTFGRECHRLLREFNFSDNKISQAMKSSLYIFIDFNGGGDRLTESDLSTKPDSISVALEKRIFARAIMHKSFDVISKHLTQVPDELFSFGSTFRYLRKKSGISNDDIPITIFLHLDEFPLAHDFVVENNHPSFVNTMIEGLGTYRCNGETESDANNEKVFLIPLLTGTTSKDIIIYHSKNIHHFFPGLWSRINLDGQVSNPVFVNQSDLQSFETSEEEVAKEEIKATKNPIIKAKNVQVEEEQEEEQEIIEEINETKTSQRTAKKKEVQPVESKKSSARLTDKKRAIDELDEEEKDLEIDQVPKTPSTKSAKKP